MRKGVSKEKVYMGKYLLFSIFISAFLGFKAQTSYEFKQAVPPDAEKVIAINSNYYGKYKNEETGTIFQFDSEGITMISIIYSHISKEQVRETSKYQYRNGYLFGVVEGDSLPCLLEDDKYYFGIQQKTKLSEEKQNACIKKISDKNYMLNFMEGKSFSPSMITFSGKSMFLKHFDYPSSTDIFSEIKDKKITNGVDYTTEILNPNQKEWDKINEKLMFDKAREFVRVD